MIEGKYHKGNIDFLYSRRRLIIIFIFLCHKLCAENILSQWNHIIIIKGKQLSWRRITTFAQMKNGSEGMSSKNNRETNERTVTLQLWQRGT